MADIITSLGAITIVPKGAYSNLIEYKRLNLVNHEGNSFLYINSTPSIGNDTDDTDYWMQITTRGGITNIVRTDGDGSPSTVDTYTIYYDAGATSTFTVTNGSQGSQGEQGEIGPQGNIGPQGIQGNIGPQGIQGIPGPVNEADGGVASSVYGGATVIDGGGA